jgi:hypothetical protein
MPEPDEFYVGYQPRAPGGLARFIATRVAMLLAICVGIGAVLVASQQGFSKAVFEFGGIRKFEGWIETTPYPQLVLPRPAQTGETAPMSRYLLVGSSRLSSMPARARPANRWASTASSERSWTASATWA